MNLEELLRKESEKAIQNNIQTFPLKTGFKDVG